MWPIILYRVEVLGTTMKPQVSSNLSNHKYSTNTLQGRYIHQNQLAVSAVLTSAAAYLVSFSKCSGDPEYSIG